MKLEDYVKVIWDKTPIIVREEIDYTPLYPSRSKRLFEAYSDSPVFRFYSDRKVVSVEASNDKIDILVAK